ncbi:MAG TPA: heparinase II/III family protein, partial [Pseudolabrys sp.]
WTFGAENHPVEIEESVFLAGADRPRRTVQIVIYGHARDKPQVRWQIAHLPRTPSGAAPNPDEPELPL